MKYLEFDPSNTAAWVKWAQLEAMLFALDRARYLFDLGTSQELDMPEVLWKVCRSAVTFLEQSTSRVADLFFSRFSFDPYRLGLISNSSKANESESELSTRLYLKRLVTSRYMFS